MSGEIEALAATVRQALDGAEQWAPLLPDRAAIQETLTAGVLSVNHARALQATANSALVLAQVGSLRDLVDKLLAEPHAKPPRDILCASWLGGPCDCGRDTRVAAYLQLLARPYQQEDGRG